MARIWESACTQAHIEGGGRLCICKTFCKSSSLISMNMYCSPDLYERMAISFCKCRHWMSVLYPWVPKCSIFEIFYYVFVLLGVFWWNMSEIVDLDEYLITLWRWCTTCFLYQEGMVEQRKIGLSQPFDGSVHLPAFLRPAFNRNLLPSSSLSQTSR